jgi:hypothetical protein
VEEDTAVMRNVRRFLLGFIDQRTPLLFLVGATLLGLGGATDVLGVVAGGVLLLVVAALLYRLVVEDLRPDLAVSVPGKPAGQHKGLIALVSYGRLSDIPATAAIKYHLAENEAGASERLRCCWLVATEAPSQKELDPTAGVVVPYGEPPQSSAKNALDLCDRYRERLDKVEVITIGDADDPEDTFVAVEEAYRRARKRHGLEAGEVIADFTGGTKAMTAGMVLACVGKGRRLEYMKPRKYKPDGRADAEAGSEARLVEVEFLWSRKRPAAGGIDEP